MTSDKFEFPSKGFYLVGKKVAESDYFLTKLNASEFYGDEFNFNLSAFCSAARSITFSLQTVMSKFPNFDEWYLPHQQSLKDNEIARFFVDLRNYIQKVGDAPIGYSGTFLNNEMQHHYYFVDNDKLKNVPPGNIINLANEYFMCILKVIEHCYRDYWVYVDPRALFTQEGLEKLGWTIEDVEEAGGFPRGWTHIKNYDGDDLDDQRLKALRRDIQGDEILEAIFKKYEFPVTTNEAILQQYR